MPPSAIPPDVPDTPPVVHRWGLIYAFVLSVLALLIALFAWLTWVYS
jgi:hypothetical protein